MDTTRLLSASAVEIDRTGFKATAFVRDVPSRMFPGALAYLYCSNLNARWDMEMDAENDSYDFSFEDSEDALLFMVFL